jgi:signal transduction histidine kinase
MPETFPTSPPAPRAVRMLSVLLALSAIGLASRTTLTSRAWIGRVFPGFMVLDNRVVASIGLADWTGAAESRLYQSEIVAVQGHPAGTARDILQRVAALPPDTPVTYTIRRGASERDVVIATQLFTIRDWLLLFGAFLLNAAAYLASGLIVWVLRPRAAVARALVAVGAAWAFFLITALDLYGPATFFRLHVACESLVPPAVLQLALLFPQPHRLARWRFVGYVPSLAIIALYERFLYRPPLYSAMLYANMTYLGLATFFFGGRLIHEYVRGRSHLARQRVRVVMLGTLCGFSIPGAIVLTSVAMGGGTAMNVGATTQFLFSLSLTYAILKHDLFDIDAMLKRAAYYVVLSALIAGAYIGAVVVFDAGLKARHITTSKAFPLLFTIAVLLVLNPLRSRTQALVDRVFFRRSYDAPRILAELGQRLIGALTRERIANVVLETVARAIPNTRARLFSGDAIAVRDVDSSERIPPELLARLRDGRIVTAFDSVEMYSKPTMCETVRAQTVALDAEVAVPMLLRGGLVGVLTVGHKRSGLFYTAGDAEFLQALAHQAAIALENARSYEALIDLNTRLEERVRERTAQLETANGELAVAYGELKAAEAQIVHAEKMASLGRLVAGVAHEINNPVAFISTSVAPLRRRLAQAVALAPPTVQQALAEADDLTGIVERGAERTAAIVRDLRAFSRLGEATRKPADLHEGLEVTLRLLEARWRDRIDVHRDFGALPAVECDAAQLNQAFMNVLVNACDAIRGRGNIWITTRAELDAVTITIRDDGPGIAPGALERLFDPLSPAKGGFGLAITKDIIGAHGGRITVESEAGGGATFRITLPTTGATPSRVAETG